MIDLTIVLGRLRPGEEFLLDSSTPPHMLVAWRGKGLPPTQTEIEAAWASIEQERLSAPAVLSIEDRLALLEKEVFKV